MILFFCIFCGIILLTIVYSLPVDSMRKNLVYGAEELAKVGSEPMWAPNLWYTATENFTDCVMLNEATYDNDDSAFRRAMLNPWMTWEDSAGQAGNLYKVVTDNVSGHEYNYGRYWHGYLVFIKPLLLVFNYSELRVLFAFVCIVMTITCCLVFYQELPKYFIPFIACLLIINPITVSLSFTYIAPYLIMLLFSIYIFQCRSDRLSRVRFMGIIFFINGIVLAYIDFLTYPVVTLGIPLIIYVLRVGKMDGVICITRSQETINMEPIFRIIVISMHWIVGYAGMWFGKTLIASIFTEENVIIDFIKNLFYRINGQVEGMQEITPIYAVYKNIGMLSNKPVLFLLIVAVALSVVYTLFQNKKKELMKLGNNSRCYILSLVIISSYPFVWYFVVSNHSAIHCWMTYRNLAVTVFGLLCLIVAVMDIKFSEIYLQLEE